MNVFKTSNINVVKYCQECFSFDMPSDLWRKRVSKFESKFTDFYVKVYLSFFSRFSFACFVVYYACCISCYCYHDFAYKLHEATSNKNELLLQNTTHNRQSTRTCSSVSRGRNTESQRLNKSRNLLLRAINIILHLQHFVMFAIPAAASRSDNVFASLTDSSFVRFATK